MKRLLLTSAEGSCPYKCYYCFAKADDYEKPLLLTELEKNRHYLNDVDVLYPSCDSDIFVGKNPIQLLERTANLGKSISISTKSQLRVPDVINLKRISNTLLRKGRILNVGISFSTKDSINRFEPHTATYQQRLQNLKFLSEYGIFSTVILKPIIAEIPIREYLSILEDSFLLTEYFLIGEEYLINNLPQAQDEINPNYIVKKRKVNWAQNNPSWPVRIARTHIDSIKKFLKKHHMNCFESDLLLLEQVLKRQANFQLSQPQKNKTSNG